MMIKSKAGFIAKLESILENPSHGAVVCWSLSGDSFLILNASVFEHSILTSYFRHNRLASFLNMYGFHKVRSDRHSLEFRHPLFSRSSPRCHHLIERKKSVEGLLHLTSLMKTVSIGSLRQFDPIEDEEPAVLALSSFREEQAVEGNRFRLNSSEMSIRLNEQFTSLCEVEWDQKEDGGEGTKGGKEDSLSLVCSEQQGAWSSQKSQQVQTLLMGQGVSISGDQL